MLAALRKGGTFLIARLEHFGSGTEGREDLMLTGAWWFYTLVTPPWVNPSTLRPLKSTRFDFEGEMEHIMDATETRIIIKTLAQGVDPISGEVFPPDSPYNDPKIIRALFQAVDLAWPPGRSKLSLDERRQRNLERGLPRNAGLPWTDDDRSTVADGFKGGKTIRELADSLKRSLTAINAELIRQELISPEYH